jgi:N-methylhydantoinase B
VAGALLPMLAYDVPWNDGVLRTAEIIAPDGLICTATFPAPVGAATVEAIWVVSNVASAALNKMLAFSDTYRHRAQAVSDGTMATFNLGGVNQFGEPFGMHLMDPLAGGFAAFASKDGIDAGGPINAPMPSIADVERNEQVAPLFYLYRRLAADTGGAGEFRGGRSAELALTLRGIDQAEALIMTHGAEVPNTAGAFGGWPGSTVHQSMGWDTVENGRLKSGNWQEFGPKPGLMTMTNKDVFKVTWQGGGGWGDPLNRDPDAVLRDVMTGAVTEKASHEIYGVVVANGAVDVIATERERRAQRTLRGKPSAAAVSEPARGEMIARIGPNLRIVKDADGTHVFSAAGHKLSSGSTRWRDGATAVTVTGTAGSHKISLHDDLKMTAFYCPTSGDLLAIDVLEKSQDAIDDVDLDLTWFRTARDHIENLTTAA